MGVILPVLRVVPIWAWAIVMALGWGGWQRHQVRKAEAARLQQVAADAAAREAALAASLQAQTQTLSQQNKAATDAKAKIDMARTDAGRADRAVQRVRKQTTATAAATAAAAAAGDCAPAVATASVQADMLAGILERYRDVAEYADAAGAAGEACADSYDALTGGK